MAARMKAEARKTLCKLYAISERSLERAGRVNRGGAPQLAKMIMAGELKLGPAEDVLALPVRLQAAIAHFKGAEGIREAAGKIRELKREFPANWRNYLPLVWDKWPWDEEATREVSCGHQS